MKKEQQINCTVHDCEHCNCENNQCELEEIKVCNCGNENCKENTICNNYEKR